MHDNIQNMVAEYGINDIEKLESLLSKIKEQKKNDLESSPTLFKFFGEYEKYIENNLSPKYLKSVRLSFKHLISYFGENKPLAGVGIKDAESFKQHLIKQAPKGYANYLRDIRAAFNVAIQWDEITVNPFAKIKFLKTQQQKPIFLTRDELQKILDKTSNRILHNIILFAFNSGCRIGEIVSLKWKHIDKIKNVITIGGDDFTTKTRKQRFIPINKEIESVLTSMNNAENNPQQNVFCKESGFPYNRDYVSRCFKKACRAAGMPEEVHFHTLRHSFGSILAMKGVPLVTIKELMGHSSIMSTMIYMHCNYDSMKYAVDNLNVA